MRELSMASLAVEHIYYYVELCSLRFIFITYLFRIIFYFYLYHFFPMNFSADPL